MQMHTLSTPVDILRYRLHMDAESLSFADWLRAEIARQDLEPRDIYLGRQLYIKRELAGARVLVRLSSGQLTVYCGEVVVRRLAIPGPREG